VFRQVYIEDWFRDTRYGTYIFIYVAGDAGSWGGITKRFRLIVRMRRDGSLSSLSIVPASVVAADIRGWYGPTGALTFALAKELAFHADQHVDNFFPEKVYRSTTDSLLAFAYSG
jgi:hypothetical protein